MRILIVANKTWEVEPLVAAWTEKKARPAAFVEVEVGFHPALPVALPGARLRAVIEQVGAKGPVSGEIEVFCIEDHLGDKASSSHHKLHTALPRISALAFEGAAPDVVIAFGTAGIPSDVSHNGCVVIGTRVYIHDPWRAKPAADRAAQGTEQDPLLALPEEDLDRALESPRKDPGLFRSIPADVRHAAEARFLPAPVQGDALPRVLAGHGYAALSTVNVSSYDDYIWADAETLERFAANVRQREIGSMETTHGLVRLTWREASFLFVSGLADRVGHFNAEVTPRAYSQNFAAAHNAGVAAAFLAAELVRLWGEPPPSPADRVARAMRAAERIGSARAFASGVLADEAASPESARETRRIVDEARAKRAFFTRRARVEQDHAKLGDVLREEQHSRFLSELATEGALPAAGALELLGILPLMPVIKKKRILAEGDSWFDYPDPRVGSVIDHLRPLLAGSASILNLAHLGDEVRAMLGREQAERLIATLINPDLGPFDVLMFSGGGNDIVGDQLSLLVRPHAAGMPASDALVTERVKAILDWVMTGYEELVKIRDAYAKKTWILVHGYDFAPVTGKGVCYIGPWLRPSLRFRGWTEQDEQDEIVKQLLLAFKARLDALAKNHDRVRVVPTQGTLGPNEWANEIHPNWGGFEKIAGRFAEALKQLP